MALALPAPRAHAEIIGSLEVPDGIASGTSNVQGWVFTNTPGAELIQPFAVLINGEEQFKVPCCGDRADVQVIHPDAPLLSGFSGVYNWGLAATNLAVPVAAADAPQGGPIATEILVQVVVTDTAGGVEILGKTVELYHPTTWPRSSLAAWEELVGPVAQPAGLLPIESSCTLFNDGLTGAASLACSDMVFTGPGMLTETCPVLFFRWERSSQSFALTSDCPLLGP